MSVDKSAALAPATIDPLAFLRTLLPGLALAGAVAYLSVQIEPLTTKAALATVGKKITITAPVIALLIGMVLHPIANRPTFAVGTSFAIKKVLRWAIALFGLKIAFVDIIGLGLGTAVMVIVAMTSTLVSGVLFARLYSRGDLYGALAGAATAVCGASAALATASVLPHYRERESDTVFVAILATVAMVVYPALCDLLGFDQRTTGIFLGSTIQDIAQVVGAGYAVSDAAGNAATIVKLFRVFMLLPVVLGVGWWFASEGGDAHKAKVPVPVFAIMFLVFVCINSLGVIPSPAKTTLVEASGWGLLLAIAALGLGTSLGTILRVGPRHLLVVLSSSGVILVVPLLWLLLLG